MDIVGIGTDIVECLRIGRMIEQHGELFLTRVFTDREIRYSQSRQRATEHFAARWAAKEAILKAIGASGRRGLCWTELEIRHDPGGRPRVLLAGAIKEIARQQQVGDILLSLAHCRAYATAYAIALRSGTVLDDDDMPF
jgi:holo-[acyl-carrier protein] synthase